MKGHSFESRPADRISWVCRGYLSHPKEFRAVSWNRLRSLSFTSFQTHLSVILS